MCRRRELTQFSPPAPHCSAFLPTSVGACGHGRRTQLLVFFAGPWCLVQGKVSGNIVPRRAPNSGMGGRARDGILYIPDKPPHLGAISWLQPLQIDVLWALWVHILAPLHGLPV